MATKKKKTPSKKATKKEFTEGVKIGVSSAWVPGETVHRGPKGRKVRTYSGGKFPKKHTHLSSKIKEPLTDANAYFATRHTKRPTMVTYAYKNRLGVRATWYDHVHGKTVSRSWLHKSDKKLTSSAKKKKAK